MQRPSRFGWLVAVISPLALALAIVSCSHHPDPYAGGPGTDGTGPICPAGSSGTAGAGAAGGAIGTGSNACAGTPSRMPHKDLAVGAATAPDGRVYLVFLNGRTPCDGPPLYAYDPTHDSYTQLASIPTRLYRGPMTTAFVGGKLLVLNDGLWLYEPSVNAWTRTAAPPQTDRTVAVGDDGRAYFFGGFNIQEPSAAADAYDPATNSWSPLPPMPTWMMHPAAAKLGGLIYVAGAALVAFDPAALRWTTLAAPTTPRVNAAAADDGAGRLLLMGGTDVDVTRVLDGVESFDPTTGVWSSRARMPMPTQGMAVAEICNGGLFGFGGTTFTARYDQIQVYGPGDSWTVSR